MADVVDLMFRFFVAAAVVELLCIALVAPTYWGWWRIGRPVRTLHVTGLTYGSCVIVAFANLLSLGQVSFSPLEIAKVFRTTYYDGHSC